MAKGQTAYGLVWLGGRSNKTVLLGGRRFERVVSKFFLIEIRPGAVDLFKMTAERIAAYKNDGLHMMENLFSVLPVKLPVDHTQRPYLFTGLVG